METVCLANSHAPCPLYGSQTGILTKTILPVDSVSESSEASTPDSDEVNIKNDYAQFFDEDGSFDVLGYAAFRK